MDVDDGDSGHSAARAMLDAFASVGATHFSVTWTDIAGDPVIKQTKDGEEKVRFWRGASLSNLSRYIPEILDEAAEKQHNVNVRPQGSGVTFIQLDDLKPPALAKLAPAVLLTLESSPGNFQAWVALAAPRDEDFARRLKKGLGADKTASGATKIAGSVNFKEKYAPNFPKIAIHDEHRGRMTTVDELERLGVVAPPEAPKVSASAAPTRPGPDDGKWPDWTRCLDRAPPSQTHKGKNRQSIADYIFALISAQRGWSVDETTRRLLEVSPKARENGKAYAQKTAERAAEAAARNQAARTAQQQRRQRSPGRREL